MIEAGRRHRATEVTREGQRRAVTMSISLGREVRLARRRARLSQGQLAERVGIDQSRISQIERGLGIAVPLRTWIALGVALGRPLAISFTRPLGESREPADAGHLAMQEALLQLARVAGRQGSFELPTRPADPHRSIDVCVRDDRHRALIIQEAWNTVGDLGASIRSTHRKVAEANDLAVVIGGGGPAYRVAAVWVMRPTAANRALLARYPGILTASFPGSSRLWVASLFEGAPPPDQPGLVWLDPRTGRLTEVRLRARLAPPRRGPPLKRPVA